MYYFNNDIDIARGGRRRELGGTSNRSRGTPAQVRPGVLTRRAAAQLAAVGPTEDGSNALVRGAIRPGPAMHAGAGRTCSDPRIRSPHPALQMQTNSTDSWGAKPRNSLRPRDATLAAAPAAAELRANPGRSMSQLLQDRSAAAGARLTKSVAPKDVDAASASDPLAVADYAKDIFSYYQGVEPQFMVASDYMSKQVTRVVGGCRVCPGARHAIQWDCRMADLLTQRLWHPHRTT